jgi:hypothetical protein
MRSTILFSGIATCLALAGCGNDIKAGNLPTAGTQGQASGGAAGVGGTQASGGSGTVGTGGASTSAGGLLGSGGRSNPGGRPGTGGATRPATGGTRGTGGILSGNGGSSATGTGAGIDGGLTVNCAAEMPTNGKTYTGASVYGTINGLNYGIWTNGNGGSITVFPDVRAFAASWDESKNFLAHLGLDFRTNKPYTAYGTITANFVEKKSGTPGGFSMIGMYGWMHNPCIEWYINEDSWNGLYGRGNVTAVIDGETYYLATVTTTGTDGANACESGHTGSWTQLKSTRKTARQCGTVTVSDHFKAWEAQGWALGSLRSVHINVEVGGGTGTIVFPVADVTTTSQ